MHKAMLWGTFVEPTYRGRGIARLVVAKAIAHARQNSARRINLTVFVPNAPAVALYESLGFTAYGLEPEAVFLGGRYYGGQQMTLMIANTES